MAETIYKIDGSRETDGVDKISKTKRKQQMLELQDLGEELVALSKDALKKTPMSDELREAIKEYQRIPTHGAHRRQMQYIGKIMRNEDTAPIIEKLKQLKGSSTAATALLHRIERYRTEMIANDAAITQFLADFPAVDAQPLRALVRNARKEAEQVKPPKAYRELFQLIKTALETPVDDDDGVGITDNSIEE
ncbi:MAG: DUF615 domain-containing protein [Hydromonas sp.]|jgi:ribosome-associated protein|nr:DUF615 domain-containing protein [Hydromonas sp.]